MALFREMPIHKQSQYSLCIQILGLNHKEAACQQSTRELANEFMDYIKAPKEDEAIRFTYERHLAILVSNITRNNYCNVYSLHNLYYIEKIHP